MFPPMDPSISSPCPFCETPLQVLSQQISRGVQCPYCQTALTLEVDDDNQPFFRITQPAEELEAMTPVVRPNITQPPALIPGQNTPVHAAGSCYNCGSQQHPMAKSEMSQSGLIVLIVMLFGCFPLFWIGLLMKDHFMVCPTCGIRRG